MEKIYIKIIIISFVGCFFNNVSYAQTKTNVDRVNSDTLTVGYTYWWPQSGPFIGNCGEEYTLAFLGTVTFIQEPVESSENHPILQKGGISIDEVFATKDVKKNGYTNQTIFVSDCFYDKALQQGDKVMVFCYEYEGNYSIPGGKSVLKLKGADDPVVASIKTYIQSNQNPLSIKKDIELWEKYELDDELKQLIECKEWSVKND